MRSVLITAMGLALGLGAVAQAPPKNAVDITNIPAGTVASEPGEMAAARSVLRVFIGSLNGADATAIQGLLTQALFQSKKVIITENQGNADLILQGQVLRRPMPSVATKAKADKQRSRRGTARDTTDPAVVRDLQALQGDGTAANLGSLTGDEASESGMGLNSAVLLSPDMEMNNSPADLKQFQYRLYLQLVNPDGDLLWMSGQGDQAPPFSSASQAVAATVQPMLSAIATLPKSDTSQQP